MSRLAAILATLGLCIYPVAVYFGMQYLEPRFLAGLLFILVVLKFRNTLMSNPGPGNAGTKAQAWLAAAFLAAAILYSVGSNQVGGLKFYPLVVCVYLLASFGYSLLYPPTVIERIARLTDPDLSAAGVRYTRKVTLIWCVFFLFNAVVILYSIFFASLEFWALYNGFVSYLLIGGLLGGEYLYRTLILKKHQHQN